MSFEDFVLAISALPKGQIWRYAQAGDLPGEGDSIDAVQLKTLAEANAGRPVIAYTHKPPVGSNLAAIREAEAMGFRINLSADDLDEVDEFCDLGQHVVVTLPEDYARKSSSKEWTESLPEYRTRLGSLRSTTKGGRTLTVCPATYLDDVNCANCRLCAVKPRKDMVIGFPAHGSRKGKITNATRLADTRTQGPSRDGPLL